MWSDERDKEIEKLCTSTNPVRSPVQSVSYLTPDELMYPSHTPSQETREFTHIWRAPLRSVDFVMCTAATLTVGEKELLATTKRDVGPLTLNSEIESRVARYVDGGGKRLVFHITDEPLEMAMRLNDTIVHSVFEAKTIVAPPDATTSLIDSSA